MTLRNNGIAVLLAVVLHSCAPHLSEKSVDLRLPASFRQESDTANSGELSWKEFFTDPFLQVLIDSALSNNQELNLMLQEMAVAENEVLASKGEYLPFVHLFGGGGVDKKARYTALGASEATTDMEPGRAMPEPVPDVQFGAYASWEVDVWRKLRNARQAAALRYLATVDGKNFMVTNLVAEIAHAYYELLALDSQLDLIRRNIDIQSDALSIVRHQKQAAMVTELAVRRFEAQVWETRSLQYSVLQQIVETENKINFLVGRYPQPVARPKQAFDSVAPQALYAGVPASLLENRPDVRQAEQALAAARLDVKVARAYFYPTLDIRAAVGLQAFNPTYLVQAPESMLYSLAGDVAAPLINRKAIKAAYSSANARQIQAVYEYQRTVLNAFIEVYNQLSRIDNLEQQYRLKSEQVEALTESITISNNLFRSARADYMEVLLTQRDALESKIELIETRKQQMEAMVKVYQALGGGWQG